MCATVNHSNVSPAHGALVFDDLSQVLPEVRRLRTAHRVTGRWTLAQICRHLADSLNGSIDGFGVNRHRLMRVLFGRLALRRVFDTGSLDPGFTVTERLNPPADSDLDESIDLLERAVARYRAHAGPLRVHPFFGALSRSEWDRLHCIHCAHHLRRVVLD